MDLDMCGFLTKYYLFVVLVLHAIRRHAAQVE
jgi:hypothetical protein